jgi:hypothetical protein
VTDFGEERVSSGRERTGRYRGKGGIMFLIPANNLNQPM